MRQFTFAAVALVLLSAPALSQSFSPTPGQTWAQCRAAIREAEHGGALPDHLLSAIGLVESGRLDPLTGRTSPWPWTINAEGQGFFYDSKADAIAAVRTLQTRGVRSIDVGCMQVNLMHHPDAFASLDQAFDPQANTLYAARFLNELHEQTGDWPKAAALYHSATPEVAADYQRRVLAAWPEGKHEPGRSVPTRLASAWTGALGRVAVVLPNDRADAIRIIPLGAGAIASQALTSHASRRSGG